MSISLLLYILDHYRKYFKQGEVEWISHKATKP